MTSLPDPPPYPQVLAKKALIKQMAALKPPSFDEEELRAFLIAYYKAHEDFPTLREIQTKFGGGTTRILRISRNTQVELGLAPPRPPVRRKMRRKPDADFASRQTATELAAAVTALSAVAKELIVELQKTRGELAEISNRLR